MKLYVSLFIAFCKKFMQNAMSYGKMYQQKTAYNNGNTKRERLQFSRSLPPGILSRMVMACPECDTLQEMVIWKSHHSIFFHFAVQCRRVYIQQTGGLSFMSVTCFQSTGYGFFFCRFVFQWRN